MAQLPANRTKLNAAVSDQSQSVTPASGKANREALVEGYDTIDLLYQYVSNLIAGGTLQPYPHGVMRNAIINGGFNVNQRARSGTVTLTAGQYGHDRWKAGASGCTYTFATVEGVTTITITAGSLVQVIEGNNLYSGTYTLSWEGTAQGKIGAGAFGNSGVKGTVVGGANLSIEFGVGTLSKVQFTAGDAVLPFQPRSFAEELALCKRYYEKVNNYYAIRDTTIFNSNPVVYVPFMVEKRTVPTVTVSSGNGVAGKLTDGAGVDQAVNSGVAGSITANGFVIYNNSGTNLSAPAGGRFYFIYSADAEL